jgi:hypothetical protein
MRCTLSAALFLVTAGTALAQTDQQVAEMKATACYCTESIT